MLRDESNAIIVALATKLKESGSWCGETHLQKTSYFLREMMDVPLAYDFILYKHGPYSFDLTDEITALRADRILGLQPKGNYGPSIVSGDNIKWYLNKYADTIDKYKNQVDFVANLLADKKVVDLEQLGTALYVTREGTAGLDVEIRAKRLNELKPHVTLDDARKAVMNIDEYLISAEPLKVQN